MGYPCEGNPRGGNVGNVKMVYDKLLLARFTGLIALVGALTSANATNIMYAPKNEPKMLALLPPYCKYTTYYKDEVPGGKDPTEFERWNKIMGEKNFIHLHHYCFGLTNT